MRTLHHNVQCHLGQSEDWIFTVSLVAHTDVTSFPAILTGIGRFLCSVNTLIEYDFLFDLSSDHDSVYGCLVNDDNFFFHLLYPHHKMFIPPPQNVGGGAILDSLCPVGPLVGPSVRRSVSNSCPLYNSFTNGRISFKLEWDIHLN